MNAFKLIAVRPRKGCSKEILKNLKEGEFYFFDNSYKPTRDENFIIGNGNSLPDDFFIKNKALDHSSLQSLNIQAVVGKNGEGKSSLVEFVIRLLNNFFKHYNVHEITSDLIYINNLCGDLYFSIAEVVHKISLDFVEDSQEITFVNQFHDNIIQGREYIAEQLFFMIYVNYSLYALNSEDYERENLILDDLDTMTPWINKIFHKNDGYQTPLSIHPFRDNGAMDVNREKELLQQRLINLVLTESSHANITESLEVHSITLKFSNRNPLLKQISVIVKGNEALKTRDNYGILWNRLENEIESSWNSVFNKFLLNFIEDWDPDGTIEVDENMEYILGSDKEKISKFLQEIDPIKSIEILKIGGLCSSLQRKIGINLDLTDKLVSALFQYLVVKSNKILRYPKYKKYQKKISRELLASPSVFDEFVDDILKDASHTSIKFRQSYYLLKLAHEFPECELINYYQSIVEDLSTEDFLPDLTTLNRLIQDAINLSQNEKIDKIYLNPPSIFETDIILRNKENPDTDISLRSLSSGEYQKIGLISSMIYHLKNLDSIERNNSFGINNYENVLLILDEIELYFHPDFQRTFISEFLFKIGEIRFKRLKSINILFVTHSPFILSDIPKNNVMFLEKGRQVYPMVENTFGANIHTLLQHGFFLNSLPIGNFAKDKINELFNTLHNCDINVPKYKDLEKSIQLVSEPFIKSQLLKLYHERKDKTSTDNKDDLIFSLTKKVQELERRLDDIDR